MSSDYWTERANAFGQMALEASESVRKNSVKAGQEMLRDATALGQAIATHRAKTRWDRRQGVWYSDKPLEDLLLATECTLSDAVSVKQLTVNVDMSTSQIVAQCSWRENLPKFPNSFHEAKLLLKFSETVTGTVVEYSWQIDDFPKGVIADQLIRETNRSIESTLDSWPLRQ